MDSHPEGTVFQSPEMYTLFSGTGRMKPVVVGLANEKTRKLEGILLAVIIRELNGPAGYFSSRAVIYGGPLVEKRGQGEEGKRGRGDAGSPIRDDSMVGSPIRDDSMVDGKIYGMLLEELIRQVNSKSIFIQFRNFNSQENNKAVFLESGFRYRERLNLIVDTSSQETVIKNMSDSRLRQVKKSLKLGACSMEPENLQQVRDFYNILHDLYRHKIKKPLPAWDFFEQFYHLSVEGKLGIIRLVKYRDRIIGGILSPVTPGKTIYEWYVCGLDHEYRNIHPSVLATWAAIEYAVKNNIPHFDFMGVGIPERDYGVREFKMRFGGEMVNHGRFARVNSKLLYFAAETGYNLMAMLKKI